MAKCGRHHLSDLGYNVIAYGWIILASSIFTAGTIMVIVASIQGEHAVSGLAPGGVFTMVIGGFFGVWWICWKCKCGCCSDNNGCCELTNGPVHI